MTYTEVLKEYNEAKQKLDKAEKLLKSTEDGYKYAVEIHSYTTSWTDYFINQYAANRAYNRYSGENSTSHVYTTNPNNTFYGDENGVTILSLEDWLEKFDTKVD